MEDYAKLLLWKRKTARKWELKFNFLKVILCVNK